VARKDFEASRLGRNSGLFTGTVGGVVSGRLALPDAKRQRTLYCLLNGAIQELLRWLESGAFDDYFSNLLPWVVKSVFDMMRFLAGILWVR
jgi:hypothetical protein